MNKRIVWNCLGMATQNLTIVENSTWTRELCGIVWEWQLKVPSLWRTCNKDSCSKDPPIIRAVEVFPSTICFFVLNSCSFVHNLSCRSAPCTISFLSWGSNMNYIWIFHSLQAPSWLGLNSLVAVLCMRGRRPPLLIKHAQFLLLMSATHLVNISLGFLPKRHVQSSSRWVHSAAISFPTDMQSSLLMSPFHVHFCCHFLPKRPVQSLLLMSSFLLPFPSQ